LRDEEEEEEEPRGGRAGRSEVLFLWLLGCRAVHGLDVEGVVVAASMIMMVVADRG